MLSSPEHAPAYMMAANAGVIKAVVSFYRINSDTAFERQKPYSDKRLKYSTCSQKAPYSIPWSEGTNT